MSRINVRHVTHEYAAGRGRQRSRWALIGALESIDTGRGVVEQGGPLGG
jgi:hypothetical protein